MTTTNPQRAWVPHIGNYRRRMPVSLARMYENALDWEHLPWLHSSSFRSIKCHDAGDWGWHATAVLADTDASLLADKTVWQQALRKSLRHQPLRLARFAGDLAAQYLAAWRGGAAVELELRLDRDRRRWITRTLKGVGAGTEIWTHVIEHGAQEIEVIVDFFVPNLPQPMAVPFGQYYQQLYARLYDEDQAMMETRQQALDALKTRAMVNDKMLVLGTAKEVHAAVPFSVNLAGRQWQIVRHQGQLHAHASLCPHWLGPLDQGRLTDAGEVVCPWHGYRFDIATGHNTSGQRCKLATPPEIVADGDNIVLQVRR